MRKFLFKAIFLLLLPFVVGGFFFQSFFDNKLKKSNLSNYKEWNDIFNSKINADLIVLGSSRASQHISPYILDSVLLLNTYNLGIDGFDFLMQYYRFKLYMKYNKSPRYIIQNIDRFTLFKRDQLIMLEQFIPYLNNDIIKEAVSKYDGFDKRDFYLPFLKYSHSPETRDMIFRSVFKDPSQNPTKYKGFKSENKKWDSTFLIMLSQNSQHGYRAEINKESQEKFEQYLDFCRNEHIQIIFVNPPEYYKAKKLLINRDSINLIFKNYAAVYNIPLLDYTSDSICLDTMNFYNSTHLNTYGTNKFNLKLASDLKGIIK